MIPYALTGHVHENEISTHLGRPVRFHPHVAPFFRGITLTIAVDLGTPVTAESLVSEFRAFYADESLVRVQAEIPEIPALNPRTGVCIGGFSVDARDAQRASFVVVLDNLLKGAASQALQNINLALGLDELTGITSPGNKRSRNMSDPIWKKSGKHEVPEAIMRFLAGQDVVLDRELLPFDIRASRAHARGLARIGVLSDDQAGAMGRELDALADAFASGEFVLEQSYEDGHSAIEAWLTERLGETGKRIHAGRSRNDQVAVALRLYLKDRLQQLASLCGDIAEVALKRAHERARGAAARAYPSSAGHAKFAGAVVGRPRRSVRRQRRAGRCDPRLARCIPLGTASGFGVNLALDRDGVAEELGFARLAVNPQNAQAARGKVELRAIDALAAATADLRRLCWDLSLYASQEFGYVKVSPEFCTGSSIMPNKLNPDGVELLRALHSTVVGARAELDSVLSLPSGYQRDLQDTKPPVLRAFSRGLEGLALVPALLAGLAWNHERMLSAIGPAMHATDRANELVAEGMSFREAYRKVGDELDQLAERSASDSLAARVSPGGCGDLLLDRIEARLDAVRALAKS